MARRPLAYAALALLGSGCNLSSPGGDVGDGGAGVGPMALFDTSTDRKDFFGLPWPSDDRVLGTGASRAFDLRGFYAPPGQTASYLDVIGKDAFTGFGPSSGIFFRFDSAIDPASLPATPAASIDKAASAYLVDVTPGSATLGRRAPLRIAWRPDHDDFIGDHAVVLLPEPGFPLRPSSTYAAVLTDGVRGPTGVPARADPRFRMPQLPSGAGVDAAHVVCATVFTTSDPTAGMKLLRDAVTALPAPAIDDGSFKFIVSEKGYDHYEGTYASPNFQQGDPPYTSTGGGISFDGGKAAIVRTEHLRFALTVPTGDPPPAGWPIALYAHGTGGSYTTFIDDGSAATAASIADDNGAVIARLAMISIDQPLHGPRDPTGSNPDFTTYNFQNIVSARDVFRQGAADDFTLLRLVKSIDIASAPSTGKHVFFDPARLYFKGHSEGGTTGPLFLAYEPEVKAAVLSGAGANLILALLGKTMPVNIPQLVKLFAGDDVDEFHPLLSLLQTFLEPSDPGNYGRLFFREPPPGQAPKSIFQSLGIVDNYTPIPTIEALALAMGVQPAGAMLLPVDDLDLTGNAWGTPPIMGNVAGSAATGVLCEYKVPTKNGVQAYDGHFVIFHLRPAIDQSNRFLATHARSGVATLLP
jgi:hypothetical protein